MDGWDTFDKYAVTTVANVGLAGEMIIFYSMFRSASGTVNAVFAGDD